MIAIARQPQKVTPRSCKRKFLKLLPRIRSCARYAFRTLKTAEREEATADVVASAYCAFHRLVRLGKSDVAYATPLAKFAIRQFWAGRRAAESMNSHDVMGPIAARRNRIRVFSLQPKDCDDEWAEKLLDLRTPVADFVAFKLDFAAWLGRLNVRDRRLAEYLAVGNKTNEAAEQFRMTSGRISQIRDSLRKNWQAFQGEFEQDATDIFIKAHTKESHT